MAQFSSLQLRYARPALSLVLLAILLFVLWFAGGTSKATVAGQVVVRAASIVALIVAIVFSPRPAIGADRPVWIILVAALLLVLVQLVPLPPAWWQALPGRAPFAEAALASSQPQPWRPIAIVPGAAINAAVSLIVPLTVLFLISTLRRADRSALPGVLLAVTGAALLVGLLQFTGADLTNTLVDAEPYGVNGLFANRNHYALFLAIGCVAAPTWAYGGRFDAARPTQRHVRWRGPLALGMVLLYALVILASGSRTGLLLGIVGIGGGLLLARRGIARDLRHYPRWAAPAVIAGVIGAIVLFVGVSVLAGRAVSIERLLTGELAQDLRTRNLPIVLTMVRDYFPFGSGYGGFDPLFRIHEPLSSLMPTYFNHAHNDFVEIALDGGLGAISLLMGALAWGTWASIDAWRGGATATDADGFVAARMGSVILLLVLCASVVDYPARTSIMMAVLVIAAACLCARPQRTALPASGQRL